MYSCKRRRHRQTATVQQPTASTDVHADMQPPCVTPTKQPASTHTTDTQRRDIQLATVGMETLQLQQSVAIERRRPTAGRYTEQQQPTCTMPTHEKPIRILVVGLTGHGKSSLINAIFDKKVAPGARPCQLDRYITLHRLPFNGKMLYVYDTQGMGDPYVSSSDIFQAIRSELKEVDLMLICHRLYGRAEEATVRMLKQVMSQCGKDLLKRSVLCYTKADEYKVNDNPIPVQKDSLTAAIKPILTRCTLTEEEFDAIPICLTSTRVQYLPTAPNVNWLDTFWECSSRRSYKNSAEFELNWSEMLGTVGAVGGGILGGLFGGFRGIVYGATLGYSLGKVYEILEKDEKKPERPKYMYE